MENKDKSSNKAHSEPLQQYNVSSSGILGHKTPFCQCLYEIENGLQRTKYCIMACAEQIEILRQREKDGR